MVTVIASATKTAIVLSGMTIMTLLVAAFGCDRKSESRNQILDEIKAPEQTTLPNGGVVAPECVQIPEGISKRTIAETSAQISMNLDNVNEPSEIEFATFDLYGQRIFSERLCTTSPSSLLIELPAGAQRVDLFARNRTTGEVYSLEGIPASQGTRLNFGSMKPSKGAVFTGKVESENANALRGEILELGWSFGVEPNGDWSSGALPAGQWSLILSDGAGRRARFSKLPLGSNDVSIEAFALKET